MTSELQYADPSQNPFDNVALEAWRQRWSITTRVQIASSNLADQDYLLLFRVLIGFSKAMYTVR